MINRILFVTILLLATKVNSQSTFKLSDAIATGLKNNYNIQIAKNNIDIATINNDYGVAGGLPTVTGTANDNEQIQNINQTYTDATKDTKKSNVGTNTLTSGITGSILLYNGMRVVATKKQLELLQQQSQQQLNAQIQLLIATISAQYYDVVRQQAYLKAITTEIDAAKTKLTIIKKRKDIGLANDADLFQGEIDLNALLQQQDNQELVIKQSKINLLSQLILKLDTNLVIEDSIKVDESISISEINAAIEKNPQIISADEQIFINKWFEKQTAAQRYPSIKASTGYNFNNTKSAAGFSLLNQTYGPFLGLNLSVPIYNGTIYKRQQQVAGINTKNAELQKQSLLTSILASTQSNYEVYTSTLKQLKTEEENYQLSTQLLNLILKKFLLGQATIVDVKLAQQSFETESFRMINLSYAAKNAEINLNQLASKGKW